ncbi:MAG TPA: hypothetical protein VMJ65_14915 [Solirubrobacteraceae bacterium]|nr:hypothetical protein [Solirubrobacteraceae bacterium]
MSSYGRRLLLVTSATAIVCVAIGLYIGLYLTNVPGSVAATRVGPVTNLYLGTVPAAETTDPHPTWVSYYIVSPTSTNWQHKTTFELPAHSLVHVTVYQFDGQSGLRNPFISQATGTVGGTFQLNGKTTKAIDPDTASHVFAIPQIGLSVPLEGVADNAPNQCGNAPCSLSMAHYTISFTFRTPGKGLYRWQCFVPCAAGYMLGFGGPMQTVGYMDGFIKVV